MSPESAATCSRSAAALRQLSPSAAASPPTYVRIDRQAASESALMEVMDCEPSASVLR